MAHGEDVPGVGVVGVVGVVGIGLLGGSLALAAARAGWSILAWDADPDVRREAARQGLTVTDDLSGAEPVVLAAPAAGLTVGLPETLAAVHIADSATITDVGSVKAPVRAAMRSAGLAQRYIGGHPMAGSDRSGLPAASVDLFDGARWVLCLDEDTCLRRWLTAAALATSLGGLVLPLSSTRHDESVALTSGVPHLLALALAARTGTAPRYTQEMVGGSFADLTRVAASSPALLRAVTEQNADAVRAELRRVLDQLDRPWGDLIDAGHLAGRHLRHETDPGSPTGATTEAIVSSPADLLALGLAGALIEAVDPRTATIRYRRPRG